MSVEEYFDGEKIAENPDQTFLSVYGAETVLYWRNVLEDKDYYPFEKPTDIWGAAGWLVGNDYSDVSIEETAIMLAFIA